MIDLKFVQELIAQFSSPLYLYDLERIEQQAHLLQSILPSASTLFYSFKANPLPSIGAVLRSCGCHAEISSLGELQAAQEAGFIPDQILYTGPGKTITEIRNALRNGIHTFSCESWQDLDRVIAIAGDEQQKIQILMRINPARPLKAQLTMTGITSQFGFEEAQLLEAANRLKNLSGVSIIGFHVYYGTQISEASALIAAIQSALQTAELLSEQLSLHCTVVDLGGGFSWPYATMDAGPDLSTLRPILDKIVGQQVYTKAAQIWFESGRYLSAASGILIATVLATKESYDGKRFVILDAGINHLGGMSGLGRILRPTLSILPLTAVDTTNIRVTDVVGPLCSPLDCLARNITLPDLQPGDLVAVPNVGAYGLTASLTGFLSRPTPVEITYRTGRICEVYQLRTGHERIFS